MPNFYEYARIDFAHRGFSGDRQIPGPDGATPVLNGLELQDLARNQRQLSNSDYECADQSRVDYLVERRIELHSPEVSSPLLRNSGYKNDQSALSTSLRRHRT
jgi:hypothetical protein